MNRLRDIEEEAFVAVMRTEGTASIAAFMKEFPDGVHAAEAKKLISRRREEKQLQEMWTKALEANSAPLFHAFAASYPRSPLAAEANSRADELEALAQIEAAEARMDEKQLQSIVDRHASSDVVGPPARGALERVSAVTNKKREAAMWDSTWSAGTAAAFAEFLQVFPSSKYRDEAKTGLAEATAFELAISENSHALLKAFLHDFPEGRHFVEARIRSEQMREKGTRSGAPTASDQVKPKKGANPR
jgi:hypothetical protein